MEPISQVMPPLSEDELGVLEADVAERGIVVPVVVDLHCRLLDGHHRYAIATRVGSSARQRSGTSPTMRRPARRRWRST